MSRVPPFLLPLICFVIAIAVVAVQFYQSYRLEGQRSALEREVAALSSDADVVATRDGGDVTVAVPAEPQEEGRFLDDVRVISATTGVILFRWSATLAPPAAQSASPEAQQGTTANPVASDVREVQGTLEVAGPFANVRAFVREVLSSQRLTTMSNVRWTRDEGEITRLSCTLSRYVRGTVEPPTNATADSGRNQ